jgi:LCP family protein required for cell wall assembly
VGEINDYPGGGGALAKKTVSEFLGYPIDYYVRINFDGFVQAIDAIGGVDVVVANTIHDEEYPTIDYGYQTFHLDAGPQHLDGETALKYVRSRHGAGNDDFQRTKRQQQVLLAVKDQLIENKLLTPVRLLELLRVVSNSVDHDIPATSLPNLLTLASRVELDRIEQLVIDTRYAQIDANSKFGWILIPDREKIRPAVDQVFAGQPAPALLEVDLAALAEQQARQEAAQAHQQVLNDYQTQADLLRAQLSAEGARVGVYNGAGDPTLSTRAADWLQRQGYIVVEAKDADRSDYPRTTLITYSDKPIAIAGLKDMFAIAKDNIQAGENSAETALDLRLIIGRDFYLLVSN